MFFPVQQMKMSYRLILKKNIDKLDPCLIENTCRICGGVATPNADFIKHIEADHPRSDFADDEDDDNDNDDEKVICSICNEIFHNQ